MKVLLLGATGNLGSRILPALLAHKHKVIVYVRSEAKLKSLLPATILSKVIIVTGDATDSVSISDALVQHSCEAFINTAGLAAIFPWQAPAMQGIIKAVIAAGVDASTKLGRPLRCWLLGGLGVMDHPNANGIKLST